MHLALPDPSVKWKRHESAMHSAMHSVMGPGRHPPTAAGGSTRRAGMCFDRKPALQGHFLVEKWDGQGMEKSMRCVHPGKKRFDLVEPTRAGSRRLTSQTTCQGLPPGTGQFYLGAIIHGR